MYEVNITNGRKVVTVANVSVTIMPDGFCTAYTVNGNPSPTAVDHLRLANALDLSGAKPGDKLVQWLRGR